MAAFDFDRTLTTCDSLRLFYRAMCGTQRYAGAVLRSAIPLILGLTGGHRRDIARAQFTRLTLGGVDNDQALQVAAEVGREIWEKRMRSDVVRRLEWHAERGHLVVIASASFAPYIEAALRDAPVDHIVATRWEVDPRGVLTGELDGPCVRGPAKPAALRTQLGIQQLAFAYGDSAGDRELLASSTNPVWVTRRPLLREPSAPQGDDELVVTRWSHEIRDTPLSTGMSPHDPHVRNPRLR